MTIRNGLIGIPPRYTIPHLFPQTLAGASHVISQGSTFIMGFVGSQSPAAINDSWQYEVCLTKGLYHLVIWHSRTTASGIITFSLNTNPENKVAQSCGAMDLYGTTLINNQQSIVFTVNRDDYYYLIATMAAKNPSSSGYTAVISLIELTRRPF